MFQEQHCALLCPSTRPWWRAVFRLRNKPLHEVKAHTLGTWGSRGPRAGQGEFSKEVAGLTNTTLSTCTRHPAQHPAR